MPEETTLPDVWELCENPPEGMDGVANLYHWSTNYDSGRGPFTLFLDMIGWSGDNLGEPLYSLEDASLGYRELSELANALNVYVVQPEGVRRFVDTLMEAEGR